MDVVLGKLVHCFLQRTYKKDLFFISYSLKLNYAVDLNPVIPEVIVGKQGHFQSLEF